MKTKALIHIVDDDASFRAAVSRLLRTLGYSVLAYATAEEFLSTSIEGRGCILLDVRMPGLSGLQVQDHLVSRAEALPIIFITGHGDIPMSVRAIKAGADNFLTKPVPRDALVAAIQAALAKFDETRADRQYAHDVRQRFQRLTPREVEVFERVVAGKLNREVATELGTTERTVKAHRHQVMAKMSAASLAELVNMARLIERSG